MARGVALRRPEEIESDSCPNILANFFDGNNEVIDEMLAMFLAEESELHYARKVVTLAANEEYECDGCNSDDQTEEPRNHKRRRRRKHKIIKPFWFNDNGNNGEVIFYKPRQT